jgi:hypothetical protein
LQVAEFLLTVVPFFRQVKFKKEIMLSTAAKSLSKAGFQVSKKKPLGMGNHAGDRAIRLFVLKDS